MADANPNARLETFCDGVFAIALTLLVIDLKLPSPEGIRDTAAFWHALRHLTPALLAFVLSFFVILITWVNHHSAMTLVGKSSGSFIYANGFLLLTVVLVPFPTSLLGEFLLTQHAAPTVALYNAVLAAQAVGWLLIGGTALRNHLTKDERATATLRKNTRHGSFGFALYSVLSVTALWFPLPVAIVTMLSWIFWLVLSIRTKHA